MRLTCSTKAGFYWRHQRFLLAQPHWDFRFWYIYRVLVFHPKIWKMIICQNINLLQHCRQLLESLSQGVKSHKLCFYSGLSGSLPPWKHWLPDIPWKIEASFTAFRCGCGVTVTWSICQVKEPPADSKQPVGKMPFMRSSIVPIHSFTYFSSCEVDTTCCMKWKVLLKISFILKFPYHSKWTLSVTSINSVSLLNVHELHRNAHGPFLTFFTVYKPMIVLWCHKGQQSLLPGSVTTPPVKCLCSPVLRPPRGWVVFLRSINMSVDHFCGRL